MHYHHGILVGKCRLVHSIYILFRSSASVARTGIWSRAPCPQSCEPDAHALSSETPKTLDYRVESIVGLFTRMEAITSRGV